MKCLKTEIERVKFTEALTIQRKGVKFSNLDNIQLKNYTGKLKHSVIDETSPYVKLMNDNGFKIIVKKASFSWLISNDCRKLSSDRLHRVSGTTCDTKTTFIGLSNIKIKVKQKKASVNRCVRKHINERFNLFA